MSTNALGLGWVIPDLWAVQLLSNRDRVGDRFDRVAFSPYWAASFLQSCSLSATATMKIWLSSC